MAGAESRKIKLKGNIRVVAMLSAAGTVSHQHCSNSSGGCSSISVFTAHTRSCCIHGGSRLSGRKTAATEASRSAIARTSVERVPCHSVLSPKGIHPDRSMASIKLSQQHRIGDVADRGRACLALWFTLTANVRPFHTLHPCGIPYLLLLRSTC